MPRPKKEQTKAPLNAPLSESEKLLLTDLGFEVFETCAVRDTFEIVKKGEGSFISYNVTKECVMENYKEFECLPQKI